MAKVPFGNLAWVSVTHPELALVDDDTMAGQRCTTGFRAVDNISRLSHALDRIQVRLQRWENLQRSSFVCLYLLVFCSYPLLNYMFYYLLTVYNTLFWQVKYAYICLALPTFAREENHRSLPNSCNISTIFRDLTNMFTSYFLISLGTTSLVVLVCVSL